MSTYMRLPYFQEKERYLGWNTWDEVVFSLRWNTCLVALYSLIYPVLIELVVFLGQYETLILFLFVQENISIVSVPLAKIKCIAYGNCRRIYIYRYIYRVLTVGLCLIVIKRSSSLQFRELPSLLTKKNDVFVVVL